MATSSVNSRSGLTFSVKRPRTSRRTTNSNGGLPGCFCAHDFMKAPSVLLSSKCSVVADVDVRLRARRFWCEPLPASSLYLLLHKCEVSLPVLFVLLWCVITLLTSGPACTLQLVVCGNERTQRKDLQTQEWFLHPPSKTTFYIPVPHHFSLESNPAGTVHLLAVQLRRWVLACAAVDSYLS